MDEALTRQLSYFEAKIFKSFFAHTAASPRFHWAAIYLWLQKGIVWTHLGRKLEGLSRRFQVFMNTALTSMSRDEVGVFWAGKYY